MSCSGIVLEPPQEPCRTCRPSTAWTVACQAASEKVSRSQGGAAATLASVVLHCATMKALFSEKMGLLVKRGKAFSE